LIGQLQGGGLTLACHSAPQSPGAGDTALLTDTSIVDSLGVWSASGIWTIKQAGAYEVGANIFFAANVTGDRVVKFLVDGVVVGGDARKSSVSAGFGTWATPSVPVLLDKGDLVQAVASQTSGGALAVPAGLAFSAIWLRFLGGVPN
jgi:hypothetical protein